MNPQGMQFPLGFPQAQQQSFNVGLEPNAISAASAQMGMPTVSDSSNMGSQLQNAAHMVQVSLRTVSNRLVPLKA